MYFHVIVPGESGYISTRGLPDAALPWRQSRMAVEIISVDFSLFRSSPESRALHSVQCGFKLNGDYRMRVQMARS